jgi:D-alanine-D-alanine ligase
VIRVGVLFGGANSEHEVSCASARDVVASLDPDKYLPVLLGIDRAGGWHWLETVDALASATDGARLPDLEGIDVALPILHGRFGEDGTVQGLLELAGVSYAGCGVLASAISMDKAMTNRMLAAAGIPTIETVAITSRSRPFAAALVARLGYPLFVKPSRAGSSVGVSRVERETELDAAIAEALAHDVTALVQPLIEGDEVDVGLLQLSDGRLLAGAPLRVRTDSDFFDYAAKYTIGGATFEVPAELAPDVAARLIETAQECFAALGCDGIARVDFFLRPDGSVVVNEVNTLPGLSSRSQFPRMFGAIGRSLPAVIDALVERARSIR